MRIKIDYEDDINRIVVSPEDFSFENLRGLKRYLRIINADLISFERIEIPLDETDIVSVYNNIKKIFESEFQCEIDSNIAAQEVFNKAEEESQKFIVFSEKARDIRNNNISSEEFEDFCDKLSDSVFKRSLKTYQLLAAYHLAFSQNACNFSVPGSGKTSTVLAAYEYLRKQMTDKKKVDKLVVFGPLSSFIAWKMEYEACFGFKPKTLEIRGGINKNNIEQSLFVSNSDLDLVLISYGSVKSNINAITYYLNNNKCMVVLDEAHRVKRVSEDAQSNYVMSLAPYAVSRVVLTGTPAANTYVDLYNLYRFIWPYNNVIGYSINQLEAMSKSESDYRVEDLINRISPFFIRIKKSDLNLPEAIFNTPNAVPMSELQQNIYDEIESIVINKYKATNLPESIRKSAAIRLRQAASNPGLLLKPLEDDRFSYEGLEDESLQNEFSDDIEIDSDLVDKIMNYKNIEIPNKFDEALRIAKEIIEKKQKVVIWCEFVGTCDELSQYFKDNNIENRILYGKCKQEEREEIIEEFLLEEGSKFSVIIANPHAVGESISLHKTCHNAIYLEQGFNAGVYMQSKDRIHRVGLKATDETNYYFIQSLNSVDSAVYKRVLEKETKMLDLIESQEIPLLSNIDFEEESDADIKAIIRDYYERREKLI